MHPMAVGTINLILYFAAVVIVAFSARLAFPIPDEVFRKILHFILLGSFYVLVVSYPVWWQAALVAVYLIWCGVKTVAERIRA